MNSIDELVRALSDSVPARDEIERKANDNARRELRAATHAEGSRGARRWFSRRLGGLALVGALAIAIAIIAALLPGGASRETGGLGAPLGPAPASAQVVLTRAARAIVRQPWHPLRPGEWFYFRYYQSIPDRTGPAPARPNGIEDGWIAGDGAARLVQRGFGPVGGQVLLFRATSRDWLAEWETQHHGSHLKVMPYGQPYLWVNVDYQQLIHLPTDPAKLTRWIERNATGGGPRDGVIFGFVEELVKANPPLPPKVSAALYRVIARLPEMRVIGRIRDPLGRGGIAVGFFGGYDGHTELIFNPSTGVLLSERTVSPNGTTLGWEAITHQAIVNSNRQLPTSAK